MSIVGPTGPQGPQGERGKNGRMGLDGPTGPQGPAGSSGSGASLTVFNNPSAIINNTYTIPSGSTSSNTYLKDCTITTGIRNYLPFIPGLSGTCYALVSSGTDLYVGGDFTSVGGISANYIAKYNTVTGVWSALGPGLNTICYAILVSGSNVYAGGYFSATGDNNTPLRGVGKWDGTSWSTLGSSGPVTPGESCFALAMIGSTLYAGGNFTSSANRIAKWDGTAWSGLGTGLDDQCKTLAVYGSNLYAGGGFGTAGGTNANKIAKWDGSAWSALGTGVVGGGVDALCKSIGFIGTDLYACGYFGSADGNPAAKVAKWNGTTWSPLGTGITSGDGYVLTTLGTDLYVGGYITSAGGVSVNNIAKWDGTSWSALGNGVNNSVESLTVVGTELYIGGIFTTVGNSIPSNRITSYSFNYINLVFNSQIVSTLYYNTYGSEVNTYLSGATTYASVTNNIRFYQ